MSRHRNVRNMNYDEDYEGYNDVYGHSYDDDYGVSPGTSQYMFDRSKQTQLANFISHEDDITEEQEDEEGAEGAVDRRLEGARRRLDSLTIEAAVGKLGKDDELRLKHCLDTVRDVCGDSVTDSVMKAHIMQAKFDAEKALDNILNNVSLDPTAVLPEDLWKKPKVEGLPKPSTTTVKGLTPIKPENFKKPEPVKVVTAAAAKKPATLGFNMAEGKDRSASPLNLLQPQPDSRGGSNCPSPASVRDENRFSKGNKTKEFKGESAVEEYEKSRKSGKDLLNLLVIGHVDAGKSTLMGHLLLQMGQVAKKAMHKYEQESKKIGKQSFMYAWVLDETGEERSRGITMDVGQSQFETESKSIVLLDAPGHKDFIPNMITGASQADVAVLVIDSTNGEFETGFESGGQTREHAFLVRSLGVTQMIVAVNKLDNMNWAEERFQDIRAKLTAFLVKQAGFRESELTFVPCSGLIGENLSKKATEPKLTSWFKGPCLLDAINALKSPERPVGKPLRITVNDVFKGTGGVCVSGRVETGMVQAGDKIMIQPVGELVTVKNITLSNEGLGTKAFAGDSVLLSLQGYSDINVVSMGCVLSDSSFPCKIASKFSARIVTFDAMAVPLIKGSTGVLHLGTATEQVTVKRLISQLNKGTGEVVKAKPRCLPRNSNGIVELETLRPICIEEFKNVKELGRFTLRVTGVTIAAGVVNQIL